MQRCLGCMREFKEEYEVCPHCGYIVGTDTSSKAHLKPGTCLQERYTLGRVLGQGGFGITYIAWDNKIGREVAIKEYLPNALASRLGDEKDVSCYSDEAQHRFDLGLDKTRKETQALAQFNELDHVVQVYDCIRENKTAYIIMELLRGQTVRELLERCGTLPFEQTLEIMTPVLETLDAMDKAGMIHRDVAPDNIFVCDDGRVKLLDFGAARVVNVEDEKTRSVMLKHGYAPMEQYSGKAQQGPYTDVYACGATVYKMLTGKTPPDSLERENGSGDLTALRDTDAPLGAQDAVLRAMALHAQDRFQTTPAFLQALEGNAVPHSCFAQGGRKWLRPIACIIAILLAFSGTALALPHHADTQADEWTTAARRSVAASANEQVRFIAAVPTGEAETESETKTEATADNFAQTTGTKPSPKTTTTAAPADAHSIRICMQEGVADVEGKTYADTVGGIFTLETRYVCGETVTLHAKAASAYTLVGWGGDFRSDRATLRFTMPDTDVQLVVYAQEKRTTTTEPEPTTQNRFTLRIIASDTGVDSLTGSVNSSFARRTSEMFDSGERIQITAIADSEHGISGWTGDFTSSSDVIRFTMPAHDVTLYVHTVVWTTAAPVYALSITTASGVQSVSGRGADGDYLFEGEQIELTAVPKTGYTITGWSGDKTSSGATLCFTMPDADVSLHVDAQKTQYNIHVTWDSTDAQIVSVNGKSAAFTQSAAPGERVTIRVKADSPDTPVTIFIDDNPNDVDTIEFVMPEQNVNVQVCINR